MTETRTPYLAGIVARPADPTAAAAVVQRKVAGLTAALDAANRHADCWHKQATILRDDCARWESLAMESRRARAKLTHLSAILTTDRDEGLALNDSLNSRVLALVGANKALLNLLADSQTKADQRATLNHALAADLERCEREVVDLQTLSLLNADAAADRLTKIAGLTDANAILSQRVGTLDAETETQGNEIVNLERPIALITAAYDE